MSPVPLFRVTVERLEKTCLIRASGELDRGTADRLSSALDAARADGVTAMLDLSAVSFIDTAGLRVLLRSAHAVDAHDWVWFIVRASSAVWRVVELTGTRSELPLVAPPQLHAHRATKDCSSAPRWLTRGRCPVSRRGGANPPVPPRATKSLALSAKTKEAKEEASG